MYQYAVYIVTNRPNGTIYIGSTSKLVQRVWQHRTGALPGFTKRYGLTRLVWFEQYDTIDMAVRRERAMKKWPRRWKLNIIEVMNPTWRDLWDDIV